MKFQFHLGLVGNDSIVIYQVYRHDGTAVYNFTTNDMIKIYKFDNRYQPWNGQCYVEYMNVTDITDGSVYCVRGNITVPMSPIYVPPPSPPPPSFSPLPPLTIDPGDEIQGFFSVQIFNELNRS